MAEFTNPNQQGTGPQDNRSTLVLMALILLVFLGYNLYKAKYDPQTASPNGAAARQAGAGAAASHENAAPAPTSALNAMQSGAVAGQGPGTPDQPSITGEAVTVTTIENELYKITFTNRGAQVTSWILKRYKDSYGKPLDLVHAEAAQAFGYPLSFYTYDEGLTKALNSVVYQASATGAMNAPATLTFRYARGGYDVTKSFRFDSSYVLHADTLVLHNGAPVRALVSWPGGFGDEENALAYSGAQVDTDHIDPTHRTWMESVGSMFSAGGDHDYRTQHIAFKDVSGGATENNNFAWGGVSDLYFAAIFLPDQPGTATLATLRDELTVPKADRHNGLGAGTPSNPHREPGKDELKVPILGAAMGDLSGHTQTRIFAGPKAVGVLRNVHAADTKITLEPLLDFGFFGFVGKYLFLALRFINEHITANWGWDIVLLTLFINLIILPLRIQTMRSALAMQRIQPQIQAIKDRHKNPTMKDQERFNAMNAEIMQFQKDSGVNMFGGCVPTLIQLPLLFAFFSMLPKVVELRQAHFFWLPDLSAADPYYVLPIFMAVSMFLVQFYTPSPGIDPAQQRMMAFMMPVFSFTMTVKYASGLALYWSVGNVISILTQQIMNRTSLGREMREIAAKRLRRKTGQGVGPKTSIPKTIQGKARTSGITPGKAGPGRAGR